MRESMVLKETILTESEVSLWNFAANIVVIAAVGALQEMSEDTSISPLIPQTYITPKAISGKIKSRSVIAKRHFRFLIPSKILLPAK